MPRYHLLILLFKLDTNKAQHYIYLMIFLNTKQIKKLSWLFCLLLITTAACKKDNGNTRPPNSGSPDSNGNPPDSPMILLTEISNDISSITILYDGQNRAIKIVDGSRTMWASKYDSKNNISEIRDTGILGNFSTISYVKEKYTFTYDDQGKITRRDDYDLVSPFFPDTTKPVRYTNYTYDTDSVVEQLFSRDQGTGNYTPAMPKISYRDGEGNNVHYSTTYTEGNGHIFSDSISGIYSRTYKNPVQLLPAAFENVSDATSIAYFFLEQLMTGSQNILETAKR